MIKFSAISCLHSKGNFSHLQCRWVNFLLFSYKKFFSDQIPSGIAEATSIISLTKCATKLNRSNFIFAMRLRWKLDDIVENWKLVAINWFYENQNMFLCHAPVIYFNISNLNFSKSLKPHSRCIKLLKIFFGYFSYSTRVLHVQLSLLLYKIPDLNAKFPSLPEWGVVFIAFVYHKKVKRNGEGIMHKLWHNFALWNYSAESPLYSTRISRNNPFLWINAKKTRKVLNWAWWYERDSWKFSFTIVEYFIALWDICWGLWCMWNYFISLSRLCKSMLKKIIKKV